MNVTAPSRVASPPSSLAQQVALVAYCYVMPVICIFGIVGNITNLVILADKRLRAVSYMYLRALAVADLLCMLFVLIFVLSEILLKLGLQFNTSVIYSFYQAHLMLTLINWALGTGVYVVVALSLERYISIIFPMHFRAWNSPQRAMKAILVSYLIPLLFYLPYGIARYTTVTKLNPADNMTTYHSADSDASKTAVWQVYKWSRESLLRFLPIVFLCVLNFQIMLAFRKRRKMFSALTPNRSEAAQQRDDTLLYMLGGTVVMFFLCNVPAAINLIFINERLKKRTDYQIFRAVANILEITNHASQFYVFCVCSSDYRSTFLHKFPCFRTKPLEESRPRLVHGLLRRGGSQGTTGTGSDAFSTKGLTTIGVTSKVSRSNSRPLLNSKVIVANNEVSTHLASAEDDSLSESESDSLLQHSTESRLSKSNGGTFL